MKFKKFLEARFSFDFLIKVKSFSYELMIHIFSVYSSKS